MNKLVLDDLSMVCQISKKYYTICEDEAFWRLQVKSEFGELADLKPDNIKYPAWRKILRNNRIGNKTLTQILLFAMTSGYVKLFDYALKQGAKLPKTDNTLDDALRWAAHMGYYDMVKYTIEHGANVNSQEGYPLQEASALGYHQIVEYLTDNGARVF